MSCMAKHDNYLNEIVHVVGACIIELCHLSYYRFSLSLLVPAIPLPSTP